MTSPASVSSVPKALATPAAASAPAGPAQVTSLAKRGNVPAQSAVSDSPAPPSDPARAQAVGPDVRVEQVALLHDGVPLALAANVLIGVCVVVALYGKLLLERLGIWAGLLVAALVVRAALYLATRRKPATPATVATRETLFTIGACATGIVWGSSFYLLGLSAIAEGERWFAYTIVVVSGAGIAAAGVFPMSYRIVPPRLFLAAVLLPAFVYFAPGDGRDRVAAALILIFGGFLYRSSSSLYASSLGSIVLRREATARMELHKLLFKRSPLPMWVYEVGSERFLHVNDRAVRHYGYTHEEFRRMGLRDLVATPTAVKSAARADENATDLRESRHRKKDGTVIDVTVESTPMKYGSGSARVAVIQDVTERKRSEQFDHSRRAVMERLTDGAPLAVMLDAIVNEVEKAHPGVLCKILLPDGNGGALEPALAPRPSTQFVAAPGEATARPCWAEPIRSTAGTVLGTFAIYHRNALRPVDVGTGLVRPFVDLAGIALERAFAGEALRASEERFRSLTQLGADWYWEQDDRFRFVEISEGLLEHAGISAKTLLGKTLWDADSGLTPSSASALENYRRCVERHEAFREFQLECPNARGEARVIIVSGEPMVDGAGRFKGYRGVGSDITERKRMERELHELATTDALTGIANRRHFVARLEHELARVHRLVNPPVSVLMIDLDHFKRVNDRYGHPVGDALLKHCATVVCDCARKMDLVGRMGGEEFAVLLPGTDLDSACAFAERVCTTLAQTPLRHDELTIAVTASIGVAEMSVVDAGTSDVLKRADAALYRAKEAGRNRVARQDDA